MERVLIAAALVFVAVAVAWVIERRRASLHGDAPTQPRNFTLPVQLDRRDFASPEKPKLVVVFTSSTCDTCAETVAKARPLESPNVAYDEVPWQTRRDLHDRYAIDVVPATLVADTDGVVTANFIGRPPAAELWAAAAGEPSP
ncbi:MAG TPA: hypothetical protein VMY88_00960 [Acidimicrobiales bacterium]|nr:hypothetical protein [Acidimicrobiales bacterium]